MLVTNTSLAIIERLISIIRIALNGINPVGVRLIAVFSVICARISPVKSGVVVNIEHAIFTAFQRNLMPLKMI